MSRRCACGTILSRYNPESSCWACLNKTQDEPEPVDEPIRADMVGGNPSGLCLCGCGGKTPLAKRTQSKEGWRKGQPIFYIPGHMLHRGRSNGNAKLTEDTVIKMRREYRAGGMSYRRIAKKYGLSEGAARCAIKGVSWSHVVDEAA